MRDLIDSLYKGFPIGYLIAWKNPNVRLKDGTYSEGRKVLIDGQQRVTAMNASILGMQVINKEYKKTRIKIAFHPLKEEFEVQSFIMLKDPQWIPDIAEVFSTHDSYTLISEYLEKNPGVEKDKVRNPKIIVAASKKEFNAGKKLFLEYSRIIEIDLSFQDFKSELEDISIQYNKPDGGLLLLKNNDKFTGCAGIRKIDPESAELKRMYIRKQYRGYGFGKQLLTAAIVLCL